MKKRLIGILLIIAMLFSLNPITVYAESQTASGTCGQSLTWTLSEQGTLTIDGDGYMEDYSGTNLPPWHEYYEDIVNIVISDTVKSIDDMAFYYCSNIEHISVENGNEEYHSDNDCLIETTSKTLIKGTANSVIPSDGSVTSIANAAFYGCEGLTEITIPAPITSIGQWAFNFCPNIATIKVSKINEYFHSYENCLIDTQNKVLILGCINSVIPSDGSVTVIGDAAFANIGTLTTISIPNTITKISSNAFWKCSNLSEIVIPSSVIEIGGRAFYACNSLTQISIPNSVVKCGSSITVLDDVFTNCVNLETVSIFCSSVGNDAFRGCTGIKELYLGSDVNTIAPSAFMDCINLEIISVAEENNELYVSGNCLIKKSYYPATEYMYWPAIIMGCNNSVLPTSVHYVAPYAFYGREGFSDIGGLSNLWYIDTSAFYNCSGLIGTASLTYTNLGGIEQKAFWGCTGLTGLVLSTEPGEGAFYNCPNIKSVHITERYSGGALGKVIDLSGVETITVDKNNKHYFSSGNCLIGNYSTGLSSQKYMLSLGCKNSVIPEENVWYIASYAFYGCTELNGITIPVSITCIGTKAFSGCDNITDIYYTGSETQWEAISGREIQELDAATVHFNSPSSSQNGSCGENVKWTLSRNGVLTISGSGEMTDYSSYSIVPWYEHRNGIESIVVESGVTNIGDYAFYGCAKVKRVSLPNSVTKVGDVSMYGCGITEIDVPSSVTYIGEAAFYGCDNLTDVFFSGSEAQFGNIEIGDDNTSFINATKHYGTQNGQVEYITISQTNLSLVVGDSSGLTADVYPLDSTNKSAEWGSSDVTIATVSQTGIVTAIAPGTATITVKTLDGGNRTAYCDVTVYRCGDEAFKPHVWDDGEIITPATCTEHGSRKHVCLKCGAIKFASISPLGHNLSDGKCTRCTAVKSISLNNTFIYLKVAETRTLFATILPSNATNKKLSWTSIDNSVVTVNNGIITAVAEGSTSIIAKTEDGGYIASCVVYVSDTEGTVNVVWDGTAADGFAKGNGSAGNPFIIETADQLAFFAQSVNSGTSYLDLHIALADDIFLNTASSPTYAWTPIGNSSSTAFKGTFDGNGHTISGLSNKNSSTYFGLFGYIASEGTVVNLGLTNVNISNAQCAGAIAYDNLGTIWKSSVSGNVAANYAGGIAYYNHGKITQCINNASVRGSYAGGIAGYNTNAVYVCYNTGIIAGGCGGGIVGYNAYSDSRVANCYNTGEVSGGTAGGVVGENKAVVITCYNIGKISGTTNNHGGVVGSNTGTITNCCYLNGCVNSTNTLGIEVNDATLKSSYALKAYYDFNFTSTWEIGNSCWYEYPTLQYLPIQSSIHDYEIWERIDDNSHKGTCSCGEEVIEDHAWYDSEVIAATHTTEGFTTYFCIKCSATKTEAIPVLPEHTFGSWTKVDDNTHKRTCECGAEESENHTWDNGVETTAATHTTTGIKTYTCSKCGATKTEAIPVLPEHTFGSWTKVDENTHKRTCECGAEESENHTWDDGVETTAATHTTTGIKTYTCSKCSATKTEVIPVLPEHSFGSWTKVDEDTHKGVCECGEEKTEDHTWDTGVFTTPPALGIVGIKTFTCTKCGCTREEQVNIIASGTIYPSIEWILDVSGKLTISGSGRLDTYSIESYKNSVLSIVVEDGITEIASGAFSGYTNLETAILSNKIMYVGSETFKNCSSLKSVSMPNIITEICSDTFSGCASLESIDVPSGLKSISSYAFNGCSSLKSIFLPSTLKNIYYGAFCGCTKLNAAYYEGTAEEWSKVSVSATNGYNQQLSNSVICLHVAAKNPSCTEPGTVEYWLGYDGTGYYTDSSRTIELQGSPVIEALNHNYSNPEYAWNGAKCTASMVCSNDTSHVVSETKTAIYIQDTAATCTTAETGHYEVSFDNIAFASQETEADSVTNGTALQHGDWVYSSNGAVLTATCGHGTCGHTETATIVIPTETFTYNGEAKTPASITYSDGFPNKTLTIAYENNTNAGTATASISVGSISASKNFSINKANIAEEMAVFNAAILPAKNSTTEVELPELPAGAAYGSINFGSSSGFSGEISEGKLSLTVTSGDVPESVKEVTVQIPVTGATNYEDYTITVTVSVLHKSVQMGAPTLVNGKVTLQITAVVAEPTVTHFVVACYDTNGRMIGITMATQTIDGNTTTVTIDYPAGIKESDVARWQVMVMDANLLCPLGNALEVK